MIYIVGFCIILFDLTRFNDILIGFRKILIRVRGVSRKGYFIPVHVCPGCAVLAGGGPPFGWVQYIKKYSNSLKIFKFIKNTKIH